MALRQAITKAIMPSLDRELNKAIGQELSSMSHMVDNMLAPSVFGYDKPAVASGAFAGTAPRKAPERLVRVNYPTKTQGLFE